MVAAGIGAPVSAAPWWRRPISVAMSFSIGIVGLTSGLIALVPAFKACWTPLFIEKLELAYEGHAYSVTFGIRNVGLLAVREVGWSCEIPNVTFGGGLFRDLAVSSGGAFSSTIESQQSRTADCKGLVLVPDSLHDWPPLRYSIVVRFQPFLGLKRNVRFNFEGIVDPVSGRLVRWVPD